MVRSSNAANNPDGLIILGYRNLWLTVVRDAVTEVTSGLDPYGRTAHWLRSPEVYQLLDWAAGDTPPYQDWLKRVDQIVEAGSKKTWKVEHRRNLARQYERKRKAASYKKKKLAENAKTEPQT